MKKTRAVLWLTLGTFVFVMAYKGLTVSLLERPISQSDIAKAVQSNENDFPLSNAEQLLWEKLRSVNVVLERLAFDYKARVLQKNEYLDKAYVYDLTNKLQVNIQSSPRDVLYLLGHHALNSNNPFLQTVCLIVLREGYPKKYSVYYASQLSNSTEDFLKNIALQIVSDNYTPIGLNEAFVFKNIKHTLSK